MARPMVTSSATGHHRPLTGTKLYCSVTEARVCEQLAQGCYLKVERPRFESLSRKSNAVTIMPPGHTIWLESYIKKCRFVARPV